MDILTEFGQLAPDSSATATQQLAWANDGAIHLADKLELLPTIDTIDLTATATNGSQAYDLIDEFTNYLKPDYNGGIQYYDGSDYTELKKVSEGWLDAHITGWRNNAPGTPTVYYIKGKNLYVYPASDANITGGLKVNYFAKPTAQTADGDDPFDDRTDLEDLHEGVVLYMMIRAKRAIGEWKQAGVIAGDLNTFIREKGWRVADSEMDNGVFFPYHKIKPQVGPIWGVE